ncbi:MAG TPA: polyprenyl synthetase family protein, partial [Trueperaceae bacterium]
LRDFGLAYGRAFQMQDDYLDLLGDPERLGKPVGGDLREGKATYPVLLLLEAGVPEARSILRRHASEPGDVARMVELVREAGADTRTRERIVQEAEQAIASLASFPPSEAAEALRHLAHREIERAS